MKELRERERPRTTRSDLTLSPKMSGLLCDWLCNMNSLSLSPSYFIVVQCTQIPSLDSASVVTQCIMTAMMGEEDWRQVAEYEERCVDHEDEWYTKWDITSPGLLISGDSDTVPLSESETKKTTEKAFKRFEFSKNR